MYYLYNAVRSLFLSLSPVSTRGHIRACILRAVRERYRKRQLNIKQRERSETNRGEISNLERVHLTTSVRQIYDILDCEYISYAFGSKLVPNNS